MKGETVVEVDVAALLTCFFFSHQFLSRLLPINSRQRVDKFISFFFGSKQEFMPLVLQVSTLIIAMVTVKRFFSFQLIEADAENSGDVGTLMMKKNRGEGRSVAFFSISSSSGSSSLFLFSILF